MTDTEKKTAGKPRTRQQNQEAVELIDRLKKATDMKNDARLAKELDLPPSVISEFKVSGVPKFTKALVNYIEKIFKKSENYS